MNEEDLEADYYID